MHDLDLFQQALGLNEPWRVVGTSIPPMTNPLAAASNTTAA